MPGPSLTESKQWTQVTAPPADGDDVAMTAGSAPLRTNVLEPMHGRDSYLYNGPHNGFVDHVVATIDGAAGSRVWTLVSARRLAIHRSDGITIDSFSPSGTTLALGLTFAGDPNTIAYVYARNNAGALVLEASLIAPESTLRFKTGDASRVYLGAIVIDGSGDAVPMVQCGRRVRLLYGADATTDARLTVNGPAGAGDVTRALPVPPHARVAAIVLHGTRAAISAEQIVSVRPVGATAAWLQQLWLTSYSGSAQIGTACELPLHSAPSCIINGPGDSEVVTRVRTVGWEE